MIVGSANAAVNAEQGWIGMRVVEKSFAKDAQTRGHMVGREFVAAAGAELVGGAHGAKAIATTGSQLVGALRAEVEVAEHVGAAGGAAGDDGLAQQEVEHGTYARGHDKADEHPEA